MGAAASAERSTTFKAVAFDAFPIFDPRPVAALCESSFPGKGAALVDLWRARQFEYTWLRTVSGRYADFARVTDASLSYAAKALQLEVTAEKRAQMLRVFFELKAWPDATPAQQKL